MNRTGLMRVVGLMAACMAASTMAWASGVEDFSLLKAVPADACWAIASRDHAGKEFINKQVARVMEAVEKAKFDQIVKRGIRLQMEKEGHSVEDFDAHWQKIADLIGGVEWSTLGQREYASGIKLGPPTAPFEFISLMKPAADKLKGDFDGLVAIFKSVSEFSGGALALTSEGAGDAAIHKLTLTGAPTPFPIVVTLALQKEVILVGFGSSMPEQALALLKGEKGSSIATSPRFKEAVSKVAAPTDMVMFLDNAKMMGQIRLLVDEIMKMIPDAEPGNPEAAQMAAVKKLPGKVFDLVDMCDMVAATATTQGMKTTTEACTIFREDAKNRALYQIMYGGKSLADPLKFVPKNAGNFSVSSGWDLAPLYPTITKFVKENIPDGAAGITQFEEMAKAQNIDVEKDILGWIGGGMVNFSIPGPTSYAPGDFAFLLQVKDEKKANEMIDRLLAAVEPMMGARGGAVTDAEVEGAPGFKAISIPQMQLVGIGKIVIGVHGGWLMVTSGPKIVASVVAVSGGKEANVSTNERFSKEGLKAEKNTRSISFSDMSKFGDELSQMLSMANMIQMAIPPEAQKEPMVAVMLSVLTKLPPIVRKIDFLQSSASVSTFDGKMELSRSVMNYREPPAPSTAPKAEAAPEPAKPKQ